MRATWLVLYILLTVCAGCARPAGPTDSLTVRSLTVRSLAVVDEQGMGRVILEASEGVVLLSLFDESHQMRFGLGVAKDGVGLHVLDDAGKVVWQAP